MNFILLALAVLLVIGAAFWVLTNWSMNKPVSAWTDDDLVRRLPKYQAVMATQMRAGEWEKSTETNRKVGEIQVEIARRQTDVAHRMLPKEGEAEGTTTVTPELVEAAEAGNPKLLSFVGSAFLDGTHGVMRDKKRGADYLNRAAHAGDGNASARMVQHSLSQDIGNVALSVSLAQVYLTMAKKAMHPDAEHLQGEVSRRKDEL